MSKRRNKSQIVSYYYKISESRGDESPEFNEGGSSLNESSVESEDKINTLELEVLSRLKALTFNSKRARFMAKIFTSAISERRTLSWVPDLDVLKLYEIIQQPHFMPKLEAAMNDSYFELLNNGIAKGNKTIAEKIDEAFDGVYAKCSSSHMPPESILEELKAIGLKEVGKSGGATTNDQSISSPDHLFCKVSKSEPHLQVEKPAPLEVPKDFRIVVKGEELDSPASKFLPHGPIVQKIPFKVDLTNISSCQWLHLRREMHRNHL